MEGQVIELVNKFNIIKKKGYIKSITNNKNGSGITLEHYLESTGGDFCIPDYNGIELKTTSIYSKSNLSLFNSSPDGKYILPTQWISENYGYPDKTYKEIRIIKGKVGTSLTKFGLFYFFSLTIDRNNKKIRLNVYDHKNRFINNDIYWDFDSIEEKLIRKLSLLAIIKNKKSEYHGNKYYAYIDIKVYKLKGFDIFLDLLERNIIKISFKTGVYKSGYKAGKFHDHGTGFEIPLEFVDKLFTRIY